MAAVSAADAVHFDLIVIGSGIAGLCAALDASPRARVALVTKGDLDDGCSRLAQGGIAAAIGADDTAQRHYDDTIAAGRGLCDPEAVQVLVDDGPAGVRRLIDWGVSFDTQDGALQLGQEAAHSRARIVHARGDGTGLEIESALIRRVRGSDVHVLERTSVTSIVVEDERTRGVEVIDADTGRRTVLAAPAVILASGGAARLWRNSTNPDSATGEGTALAYAAGAEVSGMEFVQFHPTALAAPGAPRFLISEAVRGEGAYVVDAAGRRFLFDSDAAGELAGRDVVARAIWAHLRATGDETVFLDCRPVGAAAPVRFPGIHRTCLAYGIDITSDLIPVAPAAHYTIGGVRTALDGSTSLAGLYACGEVAHSGVHGANRLASNSLLESLVFAHRATDAALRSAGEREPVTTAPGSSQATLHASRLNLPSLRRRLQDALWEGAGVVRDASSLETAEAVCDETLAAARTDDCLESLRLVASATTARLVCTAARAREESRGCHLRSDFPASNDQWRGALVTHMDGGTHLDRHV
ncbi:MAG: L-aspartate oxidase [Candidatus Dormibacteraeota bacterium]|nr:L-aspartate oxidase [Candidatus Dormibacteraeota bacterium]